MASSLFKIIFVAMLSLALSPSSCFARNAALVVIDMQPYFIRRFKTQDDPDNVAKLKEVLERQVQLIKAAKLNQMPIVLVEYGTCGSTCSTIMNAIGNYDFGRRFIKQTDGMFQRGSGITQQVEEFLEPFEVTDLLEIGANGGACVRKSIIGSLRRGYRVWTDPFAIADFNCEDFKFPYRYKGDAIDVDAPLKGKLKQSKLIGDLDHLFEEESLCDVLLSDRNPR